MPSLREYRKKIKTVKSTQQITKAMKMVAAARLRKAQVRILSARPFAIKMRELLTDLAGRINPPVSSFSKGGQKEDFGHPHPHLFPQGEKEFLGNDEHAGERIEREASHPLLQTHVSNKVALLLVTADKGLCGSFNTNLIRKASEFLHENEKKEIRLYIVGRKGRDFFKRLGYSFAGEYVQIFNNLSYSHAEIIGKDLIEIYSKESLSEVVVIYNEFKSLIQQKLVIEKLLPIARPDKRISPPSPGPSPSRGEGHELDYIYEPEKEKLLDALLPRYVKSQIFRILLESSAAELGARMSAMDSATKNASEFIDALTLKLNRTRQAIITREIAELVGGAEALK